MNSSCIKVCVRVRPVDVLKPPQASSQASAEDSSSELTIECWKLKGNVIRTNPDYTSYIYDQLSSKNKRTAYAFDHLFYPSSTTMSIYQDAGEPGDSLKISR